MTLVPVVMAGGSGTRLWPLSRLRYPKQFLPLAGDRTLLQETVTRLEGFPDIAPPVVVCNEEHRFLVTEQLRQIGIQPQKVVLEPVGRNTAPALALAALAIGDQPSESEDPIMVSMHSDHAMTDLAAFRRAVQAGVPAAAQGYLVTFGVVPEGPATGYGYLRKGSELSLDGLADQDGPTPLEMREFVEKPDLETASAYVDSGEYLWNSGIFMMRVSVLLDSLEYFRNDIMSACRSAYARAFSDGDFVRPGTKEFEACPAESIDYAIMERAAVAPDAEHPPLTLPHAGCAVVPLASGWSDVGAWSALLDSSEKDDDGNVVQGDVYAVSTKNSLIRSQDRLLATVGLEDAVVVETSDAVLVAHRDSVQDVKQIVDRLKSDKRPEYEDHLKVHRPWGSYEILDKGRGFQVKRLTIKPGAAISLQKHQRRAEHWVVVEGIARVTKGNEEMVLSVNQSTYVPKGTVHRLENLGTDDLHIIEVQSGDYMGEDDIVRLDDRYDRPIQQSAGGR